MTPEPYTARIIFRLRSSQQAEPVSRKLKYQPTASALANLIGVAMALTFDELTSLLRGQQPLPESRCLAYGLPLSHKQLLELVPLLQDDEQLRGLKLRGCRLDDEAAESVSRVVAFNSSLVHLDLRDNAIGGAGAMFLANALRNHNYTLLSLDLTGKSGASRHQLPAAAAEGGSTHTPLPPTPTAFLDLQATQRLWRTPRWCRR